MDLGSVIGAGGGLAGDFDLLAFEPPRFDFRAITSGGTYVRVLVADVGTDLGCGAHLKDLRRISSGKFEIDQALPLADVLKLSPCELEQRVIPFLKLAANP